MEKLDQKTAKILWKFVSSLNFTSTIPQLLENRQNLDVLLFLDAASVWGVNYDSSINEAYGSSIRSSIGIE